MFAYWLLTLLYRKIFIIKMFKVYDASVPVRSLIRCYRDSKGVIFFCLTAVSARCVYGVLYGDVPFSGVPSYFSVFNDRVGNCTVWYQDFAGIIQPIFSSSEWFVKAANYRLPVSTV